MSSEEIDFLNDSRFFNDIAEYEWQINSGFITCW